VLETFKTKIKNIEPIYTKINLFERYFTKLNGKTLLFSHYALNFREKIEVKPPLNKKLTLSALMVAALMVASIQMNVFAVGNGVTPLGLEIAGKADEVLTGHQTDIENFITEQQVIIAATQEDRLGIIEGKKDALTTAIEKAKTARQDLIAAFEESEKTEEDEETFVAGMKSLATDISSAAKSMGELGELLGGLGQDLAEALKARAQTLSEDIGEAESEVAAEGPAIAEAMSGRNLPIPDNIPNIPNEIPPSTELPEEIPHDGPPTELPDEVPEVPPTDLPPQVPQIPPVPTP